MVKKAISVTLRPENLLWLRGSKWLPLPRRGRGSGWGCACVHAWSAL